VNFHDLSLVRSAKFNGGTRGLEEAVSSCLGKWLFQLKRSMVVELMLKGYLEFQIVVVWF
jgi:hypothetical protein